MTTMMGPALYILPPTSEVVTTCKFPVSTGPNKLIRRRDLFQPIEFLSRHMSDNRQAFDYLEYYVFQWQKL